MAVSYLYNVCLCLYSSTCWFLPTATRLWHTWEVRINDVLLWVLLGASAEFLHLHFQSYFSSKDVTPACQKICHLTTDSFVFKQKIYCSFLKMEGVERRTWEITKLRPVNGLKLQPIQSLGAVVSSSTSSHKAGSFWVRR